MKKIIYSLFFILFFINFANAGINDYIKITGKDGKVGLDTSTLEKSLNDTTKNIQDNLTKKIDAEVEKINGMFTNEINKFSEKIDKSVIGKAEGLINKAETEFNSVLALKDKAMKYVYILGILFAIGVIVVLVLVWLAYKKLTSFAPSNLKFPNIEKLTQKIEDLEKKLDKMMMENK